MTRYEFLKSAGFTGGALMTLLSCVKNEDMYVEALVQNPDGTTGTTSGTSTGTTTGTTSGTNTGTTTGTNTGTTGTTSSASTQADTALFVTTEKLKTFSAKASIDLTSSSYTKLLTKGGYYVINNTYVVALSKTGKYIAATVTCSHEPKKRIVYSNEEWYCTDHGARFSLTGAGLNSRGSRGLTVYNTATDGKTLVIY